MSYEIEATRPETFRACYRINGLTIVVVNDGELINDPDYAPGVMDTLRDCWASNDYFRCMAFDDAGNEVESCSSMAGYGSPRAAAETCVSDFGWKVASHA